MSKDHKLLAEFKEICKNHGISQGKAVLAFELYIELCEVYKLWHVEHNFHEKLHTFYFTGKLKENDESCNVYVPVISDETFSMKCVEELQTNLSPINKSLILVFKDRDSSSTHYRITNDLKKPDSPVSAQRKKIEEKKSVQHRKYLTKCWKQLYTKALEDEKNQ